MTNGGVDGGRKKLYSEFQTITKLPRIEEHWFASMNRKRGPISCALGINKLSII